MRLMEYTRATAFPDVMGRPVEFSGGFIADSDSERCMAISRP
jgi:hypothetical protein